jgi:acetamidase/formamidase
MVELTFRLLPDLRLTTPRAETPVGWLTFGLDEDLDQAALQAVAAMVDWLMDRYELTRHQAFGLASVVVDVRVTQIVNGVKGVHAVLSYEAVSELGLVERQAG